LVAGCLFYIAIHKWLGNKLAILGTLLFVTSGWFLHIARLGTPEILALVAVTSFIAAFAERNIEKMTGNIIVMTLVFALGLYVPGIIWLVVVGLFFARKRIAASWRAANGWQRWLSLILLLTLLAPLVRALVFAPSLIKSWAGLAPSYTSVMPLLRHLLDLPLQLFVHGSANPAFWLPGRPIIEIATLLFAIIGVSVCVARQYEYRSWLLLWLVAGSFIVDGMGSEVALSLIIPIIYLLCGIGLAYVLQLWLGVFPVNPFARVFGVACIVFIVGTVCVYNMREYFVAWPHHTATEQAFRQLP
jgi:hypothetical protein